MLDGVKIFGGGLWPAMKFDESKSGRFHAVPVLEHKGRSLNETNAIAYYVADQCGYLPADSMDRAEVLMISDHLHEDLIIPIAYAIWEFREWDRDVLGGFGGPNTGLLLPLGHQESQLG